MLEIQTESDLKSLEANAIEESLTLEFKRTVDITKPKGKAEAAKDVSAFANSEGGQIVIGLDEKKRPDGSIVAGPIVPLTDGALEERLRDVLVSSIHPRPRFKSQRVDVAGGHVLIVDVFPSLGNDLHMVSGYNELRFYKRGVKAAIPMTEPEIREAYMRIAIARRELDARIERTVEVESATLARNHESVFVIPLFGHRDLVNPRRFGPDFGRDLAGYCGIPRWENCVHGLKVCSDGYRFSANAGRDYVAVTRFGVVHFASNWNLAGSKEIPRLNLEETLNRLLAAVQVGHRLLGLAAYWGPVRILHKLCTAEPVQLVDASASPEFEIPTISPDVYEHVVYEANLRELNGDYVDLAREIMDQIFQTRGKSRCFWFAVSGEFTPLQGHLEIARQILNTKKGG